MKTTNYKTGALILAVAALGSAAGAQMMSSHEATPLAAKSASAASANLVPVKPVTDKPVVRINGTELTDRDLLREMMTIFPYARQHNGFPKGEEEQIRTGALRMIEFEELVYQEAVRRGMTVPGVKLAKAEADFRAQFPTQEMFDEYLKTEMQGSKPLLREKIRRSLLIDQFLKREVNDKAKVTVAEARAYYEKNPEMFRYPESFAIQTISIMPSDKASDQEKKDANRRAEDAWQKAKATKSYEEFGLLAEKVSEDDFHVNMGDHKAVERDRLPTEIVRAAEAMQPGQVSDLLQLGNFYTFFRLNAHTPAGTYTFAQVKDKLMQNMQNVKFERLRAALDRRLRQNAKVQEL